MKIEFVKLGINGEGIGYLQKKPVFCPGVLPGETAEVRITEQQPSYCRAECVKVLKQAAARRKPSCGIQSLCGGCALMHMDYREQLVWKKRLLEEALFKYANVKRTLIREIRPSEALLGYRSQCKIPLAEDKAGTLVSGMYQPGSNHFQTVRSCRIHSPEVEAVRIAALDVLNHYHCQAYDRVKQTGFRYLVIRSAEGKTQLTLVTGKNTLPDELIRSLAAIPSVVSVAQSVNTGKHAPGIFGSAARILAGDDYLRFTVSGLDVRLSPESFFQLNIQQAAAMYEAAVSKIDPCDTLVEAYAGIGLMSMMAKDKAKQIFAVESVAAATANARVTAEENGIRKIRFLTMDAADGLKRVSLTHTVDTLLADPPRSGMDDAMLEAIETVLPKKIIYISCNPATLAKNLKVLKHHYQVRTVIPFDLFPMTPHVESITVLERG